MSETEKSKPQFSGKGDRENVRVTKAAGIVGSVTLISRVLGYVRDMVFAGFFGASLYSDAFIAAFRIPNTLRRLFGEGSLSIAFVPVFTKYMAKDEHEAFSLARSAIKVLALTLILLSFVGIFLSPWIIRVMAPGFAKFPDKLALTVALARVMFPYIFLSAWLRFAWGFSTRSGISRPRHWPLLS